MNISEVQWNRGNTFKLGMKLGMVKRWTESLFLTILICRWQVSQESVQWSENYNYRKKGVWPCVPPPHSALALAPCGSQDSHIWLKLRAVNLSQQLRASWQCTNQNTTTNITQSFHSINSGQSTACWTLLHDSGLHTKTRDIPQGWSLRLRESLLCQVLGKWIGNKFAETLKS